MKKASGYIQISEIVNGDRNYIITYGFSGDYANRVFEQLKRVFPEGYGNPGAACSIDLLDSNGDLADDPIGVSKGQSEWLIKEFFNQKPAFQNPVT